jgi:hypothetical protein
LHPRLYEPFVIVDTRLRVQAVSHHTEALLKVEEPAVIDVPLAELLMCPTDQDQIDLAGSAGRALAGAMLPTRVQLRAVRDPTIELVARVAACGPPPAGLVILTPLRTPRTRRSPGSQRRATVGDRRHGRSSGGVGNSAIGPARAH